jgi:HlyD family secretion protein
MDQIVNRPTAKSAPPVELPAGPASKLARVRPSLRWVWTLAGVFAVCAGLTYFLFGGSSGISYSTVEAEMGSITVEVSATGTLQPLTKVDISSELSGIVRSVAVVENQRVKKGDVLASLDTLVLSAMVERAEASVKAARAKVAEANTTLGETEGALARAKELARRGQVTEQALETATAARDRASANVQMAEANLAIAIADLKLQQADLQKSTIYAPIDGVVLTRSVNPGQTVASEMQAPVLFVIAENLERMELKAAIDEADIGNVKPGQEARFTVDAFPLRPFDATIRDIAYASVVTEGVVTYDARLDVHNDELLLRPGMTATATIVTGRAEDVVTVPAAAFRFAPPSTSERRGFSLNDLFLPREPMGRGRPRAGSIAMPTEDGTRTIYLLRDGVPEAVAVKVGVSDDETVEIVSGVEAGDEVIVSAVSERE